MRELVLNNYTNKDSFMLLIMCIIEKVGLKVDVLHKLNIDFLFFFGSFLTFWFFCVRLLVKSVEVFWFFTFPNLNFLSNSSKLSWKSSKWLFVALNVYKKTCAIVLCSENLMVSIGSWKRQLFLFAVQCICNIDLLDG